MSTLPKLLPPLVRSVIALAAILFTGTLLAADEPPKQETPPGGGEWKIVRITMPKTGQIEQAFVELRSPEGRTFTLTEGVRNKEAGVVLEKVEWTGSPVRAKVVLRKEDVRSISSAAAALVSRDDTLEPRASQVEIEAEFVELSDAVADELLPGLKDARAGKQAKVALLTDGEMQALVRSLNQKKGADLVSAPRVTAKPGQNCTIEIIREFRYPTEWEAPAQKNGPWTPTVFETQDVGVTLGARALVNHDDTLDLHLVPQVVEFVGFVEAGTQEAVGEKRGDPNQPLQKRLEIPREFVAPARPADVVKGKAADLGHKSPVFATRKVESDVTLRAGQSVILLLRLEGDTKPFVPAHAGKTLVALVTATLITPDGKEAPPEPVADGVPVANPVPGKPGFVYSPHAPYAGLVDVRGYASGSEVQDPYEKGKVFRVP